MKTYPPQNHSYVRVLSIAGSDSGGGAGIQADLKTCAALGCYGMSAITALTAQNTTGVSAVHTPPPAFLRAQIDAVMGDLGAHAIKIGMLHSAEMVATVAQALDDWPCAQVILDPVMVATSGARLIQTDAVEALRRLLFPRVTLITPNLDEAACLLGRPLHDLTDLREAARELVAQGTRNVLVKGGHLSGDTVSDLWLGAAGTGAEWHHARICTPNTHGTGCTLSTAIAAYLARGKPLHEAIDEAIQFVRVALRAGATVRSGQGSGPLNPHSAPEAMHLHALEGRL